MQSPSNTPTLEPLKIEGSLPKAVTLAPMPATFSQRFGDCGATWMCVDPSLLLKGDNTETSPDWQARCGDVIAGPTIPNTGNSQLSTLAGISCLTFKSQVNCGYCLPDAVLRDDPFSIAIIYAPTPQSEPRSLVTVNPVDHDNYLFLTERDGAIELTDKHASFSLQLPVPQGVDGFRLVTFSRTNTGYALTFEGQKITHELPEIVTQQDQDTLDKSEGCDLFIGCRSHRKGILKTLGALLLADVFLWPRKDILTSESNPEYDLLKKYHTEVICRDI